MYNMQKTENLKVTPRSKLVRVSKLGSYERKRLNNIIDASLLCHVAYSINGEPYCTPSLHWREDNYVYWHGSSISRFLKQVEGKEACLTVTHFDGLVLARSAFHHSANYRSVMLFGKTQRVPDEEKEHRLTNFMEGILPGRWNNLRKVTRKELNATTILRIKIEEGCSKIRTGMPADNKGDYKLPIWGGIIPAKLKYAEPLADPLNHDKIEVPDDVKKFRLKD